MLHREARHLVDSGIWILPDLEPEQASVASSPIEVLEAYQPARRLTHSTCDLPKTKLNVAEHLPWKGAPQSLLKRYIQHIEHQLMQALLSPLTRIARMISLHWGQSSVAAGSYAESMSEPDLLEWLHDARVYVQDWWVPLPAYLSTAQRLSRKRRMSRDEIKEEQHKQKDRRLNGTSPPESPLTMNLPANDTPSEGISWPLVEFTTDSKPLPKVALDETDLERYRCHLAHRPLDLMWVPVKGQALSRNITQTIKRCWLIITTEMRACQCRVCIRRDNMEKIEVEQRQRQVAEERRARQIREDELAQLEALLAATQDTGSYPSTETLATADHDTHDSDELSDNYTDELENELEQDYDSDSDLAKGL
jgi:hypothetical protein